jgi:hypothetical protein
LAVDAAAHRAIAAIIVLAACRTERRGGDSALVKPAFGFMPG